MRGTYVHVNIVQMSQITVRSKNFHHFNIIWIIFDTNFMLSRGQICVTTLTLEMSTTLAPFRDPIWCIETPPNERICSWEPYWCRSEPITLLGTLFANIDFKCWIEIIFHFTVFILHNLVERTLTLLVYSYTYYEALANGHTWTVY